MAGKSHTALGRRMELNDVGRCVAPVTKRSALQALYGVRVFQRLQRRDPDRARQLELQMVELMQTLGTAALPATELSEVDINPLVQDEQGRLTALDALVVLGK